MKNKILLFALMLCIAATLFVVAVSANDTAVALSDNDIATCHHNTYVTSYNSISATEHRYTVYCITCHKAYYGAVESHTNDICDLCGYSCLHQSMAYIYTRVDSDSHLTYYGCTDCGYIEREFVSAHSFDDSCTCVCGATRHKTKTEITEKDSLGHTVNVYCEFCGYSEQVVKKHDANNVQTTYNYEYVSKTHHTLNVYCADCFEVIESTPIEHVFKDQVCVDCGYGCKHELGGDDRCDLCGFQCSHYKVSRIVESYTHEHLVIIHCDVCDTNISSELQVCSYVNDRNVTGIGRCNVCENTCNHKSGENSCFCIYCGASMAHLWGDGYLTNKGTCHICGYVCDHSKNINVYTGCDQGNALLHHTYYDCLDCNIVGERYYEDSVREWQWIYTYTTNAKHEKQKQCLLCFGITQTIVEDHTIEGDRCVVCDGAHEHVWLYETITRHNAPYDRFYCVLCNYEAGLQRNIKTNVPLFHRVNSNNGWNIRPESPYFSMDKGGEFYRRYFIRSFNDNVNHSASLNVIGSNSQAANYNDIPYCRYVVLRCRLSDISSIEFDIWGSNTAGGAITSTDYRQITDIDVSTLPSGKWINIVIDLNQVTGKKPSAYVSNRVYDYLRCKYGFNYKSASGYVDIDYFALVQSKAQLDCLLSFSYSIYNDSYYLYEKVGEFTKVDNTHSFDDSYKCTRCNYKCPHVSKSQVLYTDALMHGFDERCDFCSKDFVGESRALHFFNNNSITCSECGYKCYHDYKNGVCRSCERICTHGYANESIRCIYCGLYARDGGSGGADQESFYNMFLSIYDSQRDTLFSMLGFEIFGINIAGFIISIITLGIAIAILKKVL